MHEGETFCRARVSKQRAGLSGAGGVPLGQVCSLTFPILS
jgi:hypothetical protein